MSIIHDALKKVQNKDPGKVKAASRPSESTDPAPALKLAPGNLRFILLCGFLILAALAWTYVRLQPPRETAEVMITAFKIPIGSVPGAPRDLSIPAPPAAFAEAPLSGEGSSPLAPEPADPLAAIRIEGIMDMGGGKHVALINGNMYEEGQTLHGRTIHQITLESVTVLDQGQERILAVKPPKP